MDKTQEARIKYFREKAEEARSKADTMLDPHNQHIIMQVAGMWDRLADREEKRRQPPSS